MSKPAKTAFDWSDPFFLDEQLGEDERMVRDSARAYAEHKLLPRIIEATRREHFHREILNEMGALGLLGSTLPETYGCAGVNHVCYGLAAREIERELFAVARISPEDITEESIQPVVEELREYIIHFE